MNLETLKKFEIAFDKRRKELQKKMYEKYKEDIRELFRLEKERKEVDEAYKQQLEKVIRESECPICHKSTKFDLCSLTCPECGLSTGKLYTLKDLFTVWLTLCLAFDKNSALAETVKELQALGGVITIEKAEEAPSEDEE